MKKIFISWSKKRSEEFAKIVKSTIEKLDSDIDVFMSEEDIKAGEFVQEKIISNIENCDILILCFTTENKRSPWLLYEAGYASGLHKVVIPFLFDNDSMWHSWIDNPMNIAREISFCHGDLLKDFTEIFSLKETSTLGLRKYRTPSRSRTTLKMSALLKIGETVEGVFLITVPFFSKNCSVATICPAFAQTQSSFNLTSRLIW